MKKHICRMLALLLICTVFCSMGISVSAAEADENEYTIQDTRASSSLPFALIAAKVTDYVDTVNSGKSFMASDLDTGVTTYGKLYSSLSGGTYKAGVCYYLNGNCIYVTNLHTSTAKSSGAMFNYSLAKTNLNVKYTYYAFADNMASSSYYVHGTVAVDKY